MGLGEDARDVVGVEADRWGGVVEAERSGEGGPAGWPRGPAASEAGRRRACSGGDRSPRSNRGQRRGGGSNPSPIQMGIERSGGGDVGVGGKWGAVGRVSGVGRAI